MDRMSRVSIFDTIGEMGNLVLSRNAFCRGTWDFDVRWAALPNPSSTPEQIPPFQCPRGNLGQVRINRVTSGGQNVRNARVPETPRLTCRHVGGSKNTPAIL
jgi:hypothetical protein